MLISLPSREWLVFDGYFFKLIATVRITGKYDFLISAGNLVFSRIVGIRDMHGIAAQFLRFISQHVARFDQPFYIRCAVCVVVVLF
jgi:hypothetical protein